MPDTAPARKNQLDKDLRGWLATNRDIVTVIKKPVAIGEVPALIAQSHKPILFENIRGYPGFRLCDMLVRHRWSQCRALGVGEKEYLPTLAQRLRKPPRGLVNVATGIATVEPELKDVLRALGARNRDLIWFIGIPRSLPYYFASLKIAITFAFVGSIVSENVAANSGIGHLMTVASSRFEVPLAFAALLVIALMGVLMYVLTALVEKRLTAWSVRGTHLAAG